MAPVKTKHSVHLEIPALTAYVPLVQKMVETSAAEMGMDSGGRLRLMLAAEEVFSYLCGALGHDANVRCEVVDGAWRVRAVFSLESEDIELGALNITARPMTHGGEQNLQELGLLLAANSVDRLRAERFGERFSLILDRRKAYPEIPAETMARPKATPPVTATAAPSAEQLKEACRLACGLYPGHLIHEVLWRPGLLVDMIAAGDMSACLATDEGGRICGLLCWDAASPACRFAYGPYVFSAEQRGETAEALADCMFQSLARTQASVAILVLATPETPADRFEPLGEMLFTGKKGDRHTLPAFVRSLREELGSRVWAHPRLEPFLRQEYERLFLQREIIPAESKGERRPARSVFSTETRPSLGEAVLRPMLDGDDRGANIADHVAVLTSEGYANIFFHIDLADGWQASMAGELMDAGFEPRLLAPDASGTAGGESADLVIFQYAG